MPAKVQVRFTVTLEISDAQAETLATGDSDELEDEMFTKATLEILKDAASVETDIMAVTDSQGHPL